MKASLSQLQRSELALVLDNILAESTAGDTNFDRKRFLSQLDQIREQGYSVTRGEKIAGALAISVPVKGYHFPTVLSVVGIESRFQGRMPELVPEIIASANRISYNLPKSI